MCSTTAVAYYFKVQQLVGGSQFNTATCHYSAGGFEWHGWNSATVEHTNSHY